MSAVTDRIQIINLVHDRASELEGFRVIAKDGEAGTVHGDQDAVDDRHIVVHVGNKLFGHDVVVESDVITTIDLDAKEIHVDRIADWVKSSPNAKHFKGS